MKNIMHRIIAICFGVCLWYIISQSRQDTLSLQIPLCFYPSDSAYLVQAPENIKITLAGIRSDLKQFEHKTLAAHIDIRSLNSKISWISIQSRHLFLPSTIKIVNFTPSPVPVHINLENKNSLPQGV